MSIAGLAAVDFTPYVAPTISTTRSEATQTGATTGTGFGDLLTDGLTRLEGLQDKADTLAVQGATGDLTALHDYTIAATEASVATQLTVALRNKAVEAFNEIMRMPV